MKGSLCMLTRKWKGIMWEWWVHFRAISWMKVTLKYDASGMHWAVPPWHILQLPHALPCTAQWCDIITLRHTMSCYHLNWWAHAMLGNPAGWQHPCFLFHIPGSYLSPDTIYSDSFSWFSSVPQANAWIVSQLDSACFRSHPMQFIIH
jgi:hypothetical protein